MTKYEFRLILKGSLDLTEEIADELFEAGCDDGTPGTRSGVFLIDFHREADSLEAAINSAIKNVKAAGYDVERVEIEAEAMPQPAHHLSQPPSRSVAASCRGGSKRRVAPPTRPRFQVLCQETVIICTGTC